MSKPIDRERIVKIAVMAGRGMTSAEIAAAIGSTPDAVGKIIQRYGMADERRRVRRLSLPQDVREALATAAAKRSKTWFKLAGEALAILAADKALLDNVLDDGVTT